MGLIRKLLGPRKRKKIMKKILRKSGRFGILWVKLSVNGHLDPGDLILKVVLNNQYCYNLTAKKNEKKI